MYLQGGLPGTQVSPLHLSVMLPANHLPGIAHKPLGPPTSGSDKALSHRECYILDLLRLSDVLRVPDSAL